MTILSGTRAGKLVALEQDPRTGRVRAQCDCGAMVTRGAETFATSARERHVSACKPCTKKARRIQGTVSRRELAKGATRETGPTEKP